MRRRSISETPNPGDQTHEEIMKKSKPKAVELQKGHVWLFVREELTAEGEASVNWDELLKLLNSPHSDDHILFLDAGSLRERLEQTERLSRFGETEVELK